ncbi:helix-turn-helix transcriptional regulator [Actinokineospora spheciospongiae]|uniref:helix-turn-helix transcriptional regulator n=1 Tax=Actinokineospora spheciospongiae TaxID=909613 RepID=UPI000D70E40C|nr:helix-turn-helix transcriptional regulator [Actinokineospora spheciospongiae]PWW66767.1 transcriptional regulator with XRE-family HTH domain [Actinokineospora spheciospongiae]
MSALGDHLRARRSATTPAGAGLPDTGRRRVPGLRREEVAMLAGMSVDYYTRLEQGRETSPSGQVLDGLCAALRLDEDGRQHLYRLAGLSPRGDGSGGSERVDPALAQLLDAWPHHPALVLGRAYDVLVANRLGEALFSGFPVTRNLVEKVFLDPGSRSFYADWDAVAANTVAGFRLLEGAAPQHPRVRAVVDDLLGRSPEFARLWAQNRARGKRIETKRLVHPEVGALTLRMLSFDVRSAPGQELIVYQAEPGSPSADALALLGTIAATTADRDGRR